MKLLLYQLAPGQAILSRLPVCAIVGALFLFIESRVESAPDQSLFFEAKIRPILLSHCTECHGPKKQKNKLRVDSLSALLKGGKEGPAIVPGKPQESLLIRAVQRIDEDLQMPPKIPLSKHELEALVAWIKNGAYWPDLPGAVLNKRNHWSFRAPRKPTSPPDPSGWAESPIDRFIMARMWENKLRPGAQARKVDLLRRLYFDLIGLPPKPDEILEFLKDDSPQAWEELVDRLLESPRYGERWGRHWLDLARYADTAGENSDFPIPEARLYRNYVIDSFNHDMPYDQFIREQLAGDILAKQEPGKRYAEQVIATGYIGLSRRYGSYMDEMPHLIIEDTLETVGRSLMGLTLRCGRCHDHKYDPITMKDYYGLYGIFASTQYPFPGAEKSPRQQRLVVAMPPGELERVTESQAQNLTAMRKHIEKTLRTSKAAKKYLEWKAKAHGLLIEINNLENKDKSAGALRDQLRRIDLHAARYYALNQVTALQLKIHEIETKLGVVRAYAVEEGLAGDVRIQKSGDPTQWGPAVKRGFPGFIHIKNPPQISADTSGRLQLAEWLTRRDHPLTARVMVNRVWQWHFGKPLVGTPSNFGVRGAFPTHPSLLDWLALDFIEGGWKIKRLHRQILLSKTYRLSTSSDPEKAKIDPGNQWYWRFDRARLDAESIRDALLQISGKLKTTRPGPHPFPARKDYKYSQHNPFQAECSSDHRSIYIMTKPFRQNQ